MSVNCQHFQTISPLFGCTRLFFVYMFLIHKPPHKSCLFSTPVMLKLVATATDASDTILMGENSEIFIKQSSVFLMLF